MHVRTRLPILLPFSAFWVAACAGVVVDPTGGAGGAAGAGASGASGGTGGAAGGSGGAAGGVAQLTWDGEAVDLPVGGEAAVDANLALLLDGGELFLYVVVAGDLLRFPVLYPWGPGPPGLVMPEVVSADVLDFAAAQTLSGGVVVAARHLSGGEVLEVLTPDAAASFPQVGRPVAAFDTVGASYALLSTDVIGGPQPLELVRYDHADGALEGVGGLGCTQIFQRSGAARTVAGGGALLVALSDRPPDLPCDGELVNEGWALTYEVSVDGAVSFLEGYPVPLYFGWAAEVVGAPKGWGEHPWFALSGPPSVPLVAQEMGGPGMLESVVGAAHPFEFSATPLGPGLLVVRDGGLAWVEASGAIAGTLDGPSAPVGRVALATEEGADAALVGWVTGGSMGTEVHLRRARLLSQPTP